MDGSCSPGYHRIAPAMPRAHAKVPEPSRPMRHFPPILALPIGIATLLAASSIEANFRAHPSPIDQVAWLAGCWERSSGNRTVEEQWMRPRGGTMMGMGRTVRGDSTVEWEHLRIAPDGDTLVYHAIPSGQQPSAFRAISVSADAVTFEDKAHDFPQRVIYRRAGSDSLHARVEGIMRGQQRGIDFRYQRASCSS